MSDLISRAAAMKAFMGKPPEYYHTSYIVGEINCLPTVDAVPVAHGKWEFLATEHNAYRWQVDVVCSCCGFVKYGVWGGFFPDVQSEIAESVALRYASKVKLPRYCESCGAKMDGERRDDNA